MTTPLATLGPTITAAGITAPSYADILESLRASFALIHGADVYLGADTQDGQMLAIFARGQHDANQAAIAVFQGFAPSYAQGMFLSSLVKISGIARLVASNSQVDVLVGGTVGTVIPAGVVGDINGYTWALPPNVTIPPAGAILVTATCTEQGSIAANVGTVTAITTPVRGWSTVSNPSAASLGAPVETDAALRARQAKSVSLPALTVLASTVASVLALPGVIECKAYENDTGDYDSDGLPPHSISVVVAGGDVNAIAYAIMVKKTPGCATYGSTLVAVTDSVGVQHNIRFYVPANTAIGVAVTIKALLGYSGGTAAVIKQAVSDYINALAIGQDVLIARLFLPAQLGGVGDLFPSYDLQSVLIGPQGGPYAGSDIVVAFNAQATCTPGDVSVTVV